MNREIARLSIDWELSKPYRRVHSPKPKVRRLPPMSDESWQRCMDIISGKKESQIGPYIQSPEKRF